MPWEGNFFDFSRFIGNPGDPDRLELLDRRLWLELWRAPVVEAVEEMGIEARLYGPIIALAVADLPKTPLLNLVLGAGETGAVSAGHLLQALEWMDSLGVDYRIPVLREGPEGGAAEDLLNHRGHLSRGSLARFVRRSAPPRFDPPPDIEVVEVTEFTEGFGHFTGEGFGLELLGQGFFDNLPGRQDWRSYVAIDAADERPIASATMMNHYEVMQLGFAATRDEDRGKGAHTALLHRRIADAAADRVRTLFADTEEPIDDDDGPSPGARNLLRAGFSQASVRSLWGTRGVAA